MQGAGPFRRARPVSHRCGATIFGVRASIRVDAVRERRGARQVRWAGAQRTSRCRARSRTPLPQPSRTASPWTRSCRGSVRGRQRGFAFDHARTTLRACATRRGRLGRAHGRPDLPAARGRPLLPRNGCARASPAPKAVARSSRSSPSEHWRSGHDGRAQPANAEPVPTEDLARLALALHRIESRRQAPHRARAD